MRTKRSTRSYPSSRPVDYRHWPARQVTLLFRLRPMVLWSDGGHCDPSAVTATAGSGENKGVGVSCTADLSFRSLPGEQAPLRLLCLGCLQERSCRRTKEGVAHRTHPCTLAGCGSFLGSACCWARKWHRRKWICETKSPPETTRIAACLCSKETSG